VTENNALAPLLPSPTGSLSRDGIPAPGENDIATEVQRILASRLFSRSERLCRFLCFAVNHALNHNAERLKEHLVGIEVFDRGPAYDPRIDPIVRVEARRLRAKLKSYYASAGREDQLRIEFPKGTYHPVFRFRTPQRIKSKPAVEAAIAVLPFENLTISSANEFFGAGLAEELIHHLAQIPGLRVVACPRGTRSALDGENLQYRSCSSKWKLRGSIRAGDGLLRIMVQLIESGSGAYVWSQTYDRASVELLSVQEGIARAIAAKFQSTFELSQINTKAS
jgi:adenylate cyclase